MIDLADRPRFGGLCPKRSDGAGRQTAQASLSLPERQDYPGCIGGPSFTGTGRQTARALGINRTTLYKKMKRLGLMDAGSKRREVEEPDQTGRLRVAPCRAHASSSCSAAPHRYPTIGRGRHRLDARLRLHRTVADSEEVVCGLPGGAFARFHREGAAFMIAATLEADIVAPEAGWGSWSSASPRDVVGGEDEVSTGWDRSRCFSGLAGTWASHGSGSEEVTENGGIGAWNASRRSGPRDVVPVLMIPVRGSEFAVIVR